MWGQQTLPEASPSRSPQPAPKWSLPLLGPRTTHALRRGAGEGDGWRAHSISTNHRTASNWGTASAACAALIWDLKAPSVSRQQGPTGGGGGQSGVRSSSGGRWDPPVARLLALNPRPPSNLGPSSSALPSLPAWGGLGSGGGQSPQGPRTIQEPCCPSPFLVGAKGTPQAWFSLSSLLKVSLSKAGGLHAE